MLTYARIVHLQHKILHSQCKPQKCSISIRQDTEVGAQTSIIALKVSLSLHGFITNDKELPIPSVNNIGGNE